MRPSNFNLHNSGKNNLHGRIPLWNGTFAPYLRILMLRENRFNGTIPSQLCSIDTLQVIDLARNNLTGDIPLCFGHLQGMVFSLEYSSGLSSFALYYYLHKGSLMEVIKGANREYSGILYWLVNMDLSCNNLGGMIPADITNLPLLVGLNLSHNHLTGQIPKKIGMMKALESIDLSNNRLSGQIPESISSLDFLSKLNLAFNNLQGRIPTSPHFQTLDDPSIYAGNPGLCGDPLLKKCFGDSDVPLPPTRMVFGDEENDNKREKLWLYLIIVGGFATGFWGVIGGLVVQRKWRYAYFRVAEEIADWICVQVAVRIAQANRGR